MAGVVCNADFYPVFRVVDLATGKDFIYDGFYTLKVVAVTDSPANEPRWFSDDEIVKYNNMNQYAHQSINAEKCWRNEFCAVGGGKSVRIGYGLGRLRFS